MPLTDTTREEIARAMVRAAYDRANAADEFHPFNHFVRAIEPIINRLIAEARDKALEDAAGVADLANGNWSDCARRFPDTPAIAASAEAAECIATAIRALKTKDNPHG